MSWTLELREHPKLLSCKNTADIVGDIVPNLVIRHRAHDNIISVQCTAAAVDNKVEPLFGHSIKTQHIELGGFGVLEHTDNRRIKSFCPAFSLHSKFCAVKTGSKVFIVARRTYLWYFDRAVTVMI